MAYGSIDIMNGRVGDDEDDDDNDVDYMVTHNQSTEMNSLCAL